MPSTDSRARPAVCSRHAVGLVAPKLGPHENLVSRESPRRTTPASLVGRAQPPKLSHAALVIHHTTGLYYRYGPIRSTR